ncbi:hypothetical protein WICMUC_003829 [Wickerhamomyces mucosus]|uniref:Uncharacterized protein n=1 Tax=Wickerhamomyces mucosus TaxID=1378264 RepID=A0A9P8PJK0_9ASCO|nr:hypothetical protein WICMUC_003829 [Wickerhamomyces mucosus]
MLRSSIIFLKQSSRTFHSCQPVFGFRKRVEEDIRYLLDSLPTATRLYQHADGTPREPTDLELHKLAQLALLNQKRQLRLWEYFFLTETESKLYAENYSDIQRLLPSAANGANGDIIDKIPYEDKDGSIKWRIVRDNEDEGWEKLSYYYYVPALVLLVGINLFKEDGGINEWAKKELSLRALEDQQESQGSVLAQLNNKDKSVEEIKKRDDLIVERVLAGDYDKLAKLKTKSYPSLIGDFDQLVKE